MSSFDLIIVDTITNKETKLNYVEEIGKELKELKLKQKLFTKNLIDSTILFDYYGADHPPIKLTLNYKLLEFNKI